MELQVKALKHREAGYGLVAIDASAMASMGLESGDYVRIVGPNDEEAIRRVWLGYPEDAGQNVIRFDREARGATGTQVDDFVTVERIEVEPATTVLVAQPPNLRIRGDLSGKIRDELRGESVTQGDSVLLSLSFRDKRSIPFEIVGTAPLETVVVTDATIIEIIKRTPPDEQTESENGCGKDERPAVEQAISDGSAMISRSFIPDIRSPISGNVSRGITDWELIVQVTISDISLGIFILVAVVASLTGTAYFLGQNTTTSFPGWIQVIGTIVTMLLSGLIVVYHYAGQSE